jgi:sulfur carrier protein
MNVIINSNPVQSTAQTVSELAAELKLPDSGVALAVNSCMIPREKWAETPLRENDDILIIKAASGG